jgi:hypothetical protein
MVALLKMPKRLSGVGLEPAAREKHERRVFPRREFQARVEGKRLDHSIPARQQPQLTLALRDLSLGGLSAISQMPLGKGERLAVFFPPHGSLRGWDAYGRVIRCEPSSFGYRVAVEFETTPMAA